MNASQLTPEMPLVDQILQIQPLLATVKGILKAEPDVLNLVTADWKKVLENDIRIKAHRQKQVRYGPLRTVGRVDIQEIPSKDRLKVLVVGMFSLYDNNGADKHVILASKESEQIQALASAVSQNLNSGFTIAPEGHRFLGEYCRSKYCSCCSKYEHLRPKTSIEKPQWCLAHGMIYDGARVKNAFQETILRDFRYGTFPAIVQLEIRQRTFIGETAKIGGSFRNIALFAEELLSPQREFRELDVVVDTRTEDQPEASKKRKAEPEEPVDTFMWKRPAREPVTGSLPLELLEEEEEEGYPAKCSHQDDSHEFDVVVKQINL